MICPAPVIKLGDAPGKVHMITTCIRCENTHTLKNLDLSQVEAWQNGELIQNAFPNLSKDDRERLISGTCPTCWDAMFKTEED